MPKTPELVPNESQTATLLFPKEEQYVEFRQSFMAEVVPDQEKWLEARRKSEEEARQRLLR